MSVEIGTDQKGRCILRIDDPYRSFGSPETCLHVISDSSNADKESSMAIGINTTQPSAPIDICIGEDHFTDKHIRKWADGKNLEDIDSATGQGSLIIKYLSLIIVETILTER